MSNRYYIALYHEHLKALRYDSCVTRGSYSFTCHPHTNHTCLYSPAARRHRPYHAGTNLYCLVTEALRCEKLARSFYAACPAESRTHDLLIASPTLYRQRHDATSPPTKDCMKLGVPTLSVRGRHLHSQRLLRVGLSHTAGVRSKYLHRCLCYRVH